jgi:hypothetical protein
MWWVAAWVLVTIVGAIGTLSSLNSVRFTRRVSDEARRLAATSREERPVAAAHLSTLPPPVQRYLAKAIAGRTTAIRSVRLRHGGRFRASLSGSWLPIRGEQYFAASPPGFIWWGRVRMFPGLWVDARDRSVEGVGNMLVKLESTITLADSRGPELDQGALLRLLGEMTWLPTAFLDERYVRWSSVGERRARATLSVNGRSVSGDFVFATDDLPMTFSADRYRDAGGGASVLTPFLGRMSDFRAVDGVLVPHRIVAAWIVDGQAVEYADFEVHRLDYDVTEPF